jgi:hypothetical protein
MLPFCGDLGLTICVILIVCLGRGGSLLEDPSVAYRNVAPSFTIKGCQNGDVDKRRQSEWLTDEVAAGTSACIPTPVQPSVEGKIPDEDPRREDYCEISYISY